MIKVSLPMVLAAMSAGSVLFAADTVVEDNIVDQALAIEVKSGDTVTYSGVISGTSSITKGGDGILILSNPGNSFTGGINLQRGYVKATAAGALGADSNVIAFSGTLTHQLMIDVDGDAEFKNPITFTGKASDSSYPAVKILGGKVTLSGSIESDTDFYVQYGSVQGDASANTVTLSGAITISEGKLGIGCWAPFDLKGKLDVPEVFVGFQGYSQNKTVQLWSSNNKIGVISAYSGQVVAKADNAFGGAQIYLFQNWPGAESYSCFNLNGKKMKVSSFSHRESMGSKPQDNSDKGGQFLTYSATAVTVTGKEGTFDCIQKIMGAIDLVIDAKDYGANFVQRFLSRKHTLSGFVAVSNGTMRVCDGSTFANVSKVIVGPNGKLIVDSEGDAVFSGCTKLIIDGEFTVSEGATKPFADGTLELELGAGAKLTMPTDMRLKVASLTVNGEAWNSPAAGPENVPQIKGGIVILSTSANTEAVWTAGGASDESIANAANWGGTLPDLLYGTSKAFFATAGKNTDLDRDVWFSSMRVKAPVNGEGFAFSKASDNASLGLGGDVTFEKDSGFSDITNTYHFGAPVKISASSIWSIPLNDIAVLSEGLHSSDNAAGLVKEGNGTLSIAGDASIVGPISVNAGTIRLSGNIGPEGTKNNEKAIRVDSQNATVCFDGSKIDKDVYIFNSGYSNVRFAPDSTNVFGGFIYCNVTRNLFLDDDTCVVVKGGMHINGKLCLCGFTGAKDATVVFRDNPWMSTDYLCVGYAGAEQLTASIESQGSCPKLFVRSNSTIDFKISNAVTNNFAILDLEGVGNTTAGGIVNLNTTTQCFQRVNGSRSTICGAYPSSIVMNQPVGCADVVSAKVEGGVGFVKRGTGSFALQGRDFDSCGDISVEDGVFEIAADATWLNGTNVCVKGTGTLKLGASNRFGGSHVQFHFGADADGWSIDIPTGCSQTVNYAWDADGNRLPCGVYGAAGTAGVTNTRYASHFSNGGVLKVRIHGTIVSFR